MAIDLMAFQKHLDDANDLITTPGNARAAFFASAQEWNQRATQYLAEARDLKLKAGRVRNPRSLRNVRGIRGALLAAAGVCREGVNVSPSCNAAAVRHLINTYLEPAGDGFVEELVFRFLLTRGDSLGGSMRNVAGVLAQRKFSRALMAALNNAGTPFRWFHGPTRAWAEVPAAGNAGLDVDLRALSWAKGSHWRMVLFNLTVPAVRNSVDVCLLDCSTEEARTAVVNNPARYVALGELKGGIDPAGADEHWKTAGTALARIREAFRKQVLNPPIFYVGGAIAEKMAGEIWDQLQDGRLANAANLTCDDQVASLCSWLCEL